MTCPTAAFMAVSKHLQMLAWQDCVVIRNLHCEVQIMAARLIKPYMAPKSINFASATRKKINYPRWKQDKCLTILANVQICKGLKYSCTRWGVWLHRHSWGRRHTESYRRFEVLQEQKGLWTRVLYVLISEPVQKSVLSVAPKKKMCSTAGICLWHGHSASPFMTKAVFVLGMSQ